MGDTGGGVEFNLYKLRTINACSDKCDEQFCNGSSVPFIWFFLSCNTVQLQCKATDRLIENKKFEKLNLKEIKKQQWRRPMVKRTMPGIFWLSSLLCSIRTLSCSLTYAYICASAALYDGSSLPMGDPASSHTFNNFSYFVKGDFLLTAHQGRSYHLAMGSEWSWSTSPSPLPLWRPWPPTGRSSKILAKSMMPIHTSHTIEPPI